MTGNLQPLDEKFPIVKANGAPTLYFIKWAQQKQIDIGNAISAEQALLIIQEYLADHPLQEGSGVSITPSGNLSDSPTIAAEVQAILDQITTTQGTVLFRGAADWEALAPGTAGYFLKANGAGADPEWAAGGGGGGGVPTIVQSKILARADISLGITLDAAPTEGNMLVAIVFDATATTPPANTVGWTALQSNTVLPDNLVNWRMAGPGESATQNPTSTVDGGTIALYEISGATVPVHVAPNTNTSISLSVNFGTDFEYLPTSSGLGIVYGGRRINEVGAWTGYFTGDLSSSAAAGTVGGTGLSVSTAVEDVPIASSLTATCTWTTSVASKVGFILVA